MKLLILKLKEFMCKISGKDPMEYRLERYRIAGAKIGGGVQSLFSYLFQRTVSDSVGNHTTISTGVKFCTHDNSIIKVSENGTDLVGPIEVGENCFIGMGTILLPGVTIADNCIVAAGSVVTKSCLEKGMIIGGNPAHIIGTTAQFLEKNKNHVFDFSGENMQRKKALILSNEDKWIRKGKMI